MACMSYLLYLSGPDVIQSGTDVRREAKHYQRGDGDVGYVVLDIGKHVVSLLVVTSPPALLESARKRKDRKDWQV